MNSATGDREGEKKKKVMMGGRGNRVYLENPGSPQNSLAFPSGEPAGQHTPSVS